MKILWIEDFGGRASDPNPLILALFRELLGEKTIDSHMDADMILDIKHKPGYFSGFCKEHSDHDVTLILNYCDFLDYAQEGDVLLDFDIVIIDINLSEGGRVEEPLPKEFEGIQDFHNKAGFYVFNQLNLNGFDQKNTCFLTAETEINDFNNNCKAILFSPPNSFTKNPDGYKGARQFIDKNCSDPFLSTRRFLISAIHEILSKEDLELQDIFKGDLDKENFLKNLLWLLRPLPDKKDYHQFHLSVCDYLTKPFERFTLGDLSRDRFQQEKLPFKKCNYIPLYFLRNWIAHGLLHSTELDNRDTYFVFCLTLSCLFGEFWDSNNQGQKYSGFISPDIANKISKTFNHEQKNSGFRFPDIANKISKTLFLHSEQKDIDWSQVFWKILGELKIKRNGPEFLWAIRNKGLKSNPEWKEENYKLLFYASFLLSNTRSHFVEKKSGDYEDYLNLVYKYKMDSHPLNCIAYSAIRELGVKL
jgi:hypothetical protein